MSLKRFLTLFGCALGGGICVAFAFAVSMEGRLNVQTLLLPSVLPVAMIGGIAAGLMISPVMIWAFRDKRLRVVVPTIYAFSIVITLILNVLQVRFSAFISFGITLGAICFYRLSGRSSRSVKKIESPDEEI